MPCATIDLQEVEIIKSIRPELTQQTLGSTRRRNY